MTDSNYTTIQIIAPNRVDYQKYRGVDVPRKGDIVVARDQHGDRLFAGIVEDVIWTFSPGLKPFVEVWLTEK